MHESRRATKNFTSRACVGIVLAGLLSGCAPGGGAPELTVVGPTNVAVGETLMFRLYATDPDGDRLSYDWTVLPDLPLGAGDPPTMGFGPSGEGLFTWTPLARHVGAWTFDFFASDGHNRESVAVQIDVVSSSRDDSVPRFIKPSGAGDTLNPAVEPCLELQVVVEDADTADVALRLIDPSPQTANFTQVDGHSGLVSWCPDSFERTEVSHTLMFEADDGDNEPITKAFDILLGEDTRPDDEDDGDSPADDSDDSDDMPTEEPEESCQPDSAEPDDSLAEATLASVFPDPFDSGPRTVCAGDRDFYRVDLYDCETIRLDLQHDAEDDFNLNILSPSGTYLPLYPSEIEEHGDGETIERMIRGYSECETTTCSFYIEVPAPHDEVGPYTLQATLVGLDPGC